MPAEMRNPAGRPRVVAHVAVALDGATTGFDLIASQTFDDGLVWLRYRPVR